MTRLLTCIAAIGTTLALSGPMAHAAPIVIDATTRGWYDATGLHIPNNLNYTVGDLRGMQNSPQRADYRNFFVFDLTGVAAGQIGGATLRLFNPGGEDPGFASDLGSETYTVYDVSTPIGTLVPGGTGLLGIWTDLGSGAIYGTQVATAADIGMFVEITLNAAAVAALNAGAGGLFAFGGALTSLNGAADDEYLFASNNDDILSDTQLILEVGSVPEPATLALFGLGLAGLGLARRRKAA